MQDDNTRREIVAHAVRWAQNMLVEVLSSHGSKLEPHVRRGLHAATSALADASGPAPQYHTEPGVCSYCKQPANSSDCQRSSSVSESDLSTCPKCVAR